MAPHGRRPFRAGSAASRTPSPARSIATWRCTLARLTVVGAGYVGLVTVACMAELGHDIVAMDLDADKVRTLQEGGVPIYEPGLTGS